MKLIRSPLELARWLLAAEMAALLFSPPLTNLVELALYLLMLASGELRSRFARAVRQPMVRGALLFLAVVTVGLAYSIGSRDDSFGMWWGWRKLLLLPIAAALFDDPAWKRRLAWILVIVATLCCLVSYAGILLHLTYYLYEPGVVIRNHATQGMIFSVAAFTAVLLLKAGTPTRAQRILLGAAALLLIANAVFVTTGRSGYLVAAVLTVALVPGWLDGNRTSLWRRLGFAFGALVLALAVLASSPVVRQGVLEGIHETQRALHHSEAITPMSERVVYQRNTLELIAARPLFGYGTGAFTEAYRRHVAGRSGVDGLVAHDPHNQYLNIATENGLLGLAVFIWFLAAALRQRSSPPYRLLGLGVLAAWCATSLFSSHFSTFSEGRFIALWMGAFLARE
ncbi:MAG: O-antigen ligase family protein [Burkholderiales bacterium]